MVAKGKNLKTRPLSLVDEFILLLLNEQTGYFYQVPGWNLNCAVIGAVLAELSLLSRIDTDMDSLHLVDAAETGDPVLDTVLRQILESSTQHSAHYWVERLASRAEKIIDLTLDRLVDTKVLERHDGEFYTPVSATVYASTQSGSRKETVGQFVKARIGEIILTDMIPDPRDAIIISLVKTCDVLRFMFDQDEETEERIEIVCKMDLIGRTVADAVTHNFANPLLRRSSLTKKMPYVRLHRMLINQHFRTRNIPALFADLAREYGPVFQIRPPIGSPLTFVAGPEINRWVQRNARIYFRSRDYFTDLEKVYGASGLISAVDGADHFRLRKAMQPGYSHKRLEGQIDKLFASARRTMADWTAGSLLRPADLCRVMINAQVAPLVAGVDTQDIVEDLLKYKERVLMTHVGNLLPKFLLRTRHMNRCAKAVEEAIERIQGAHTPAQRAECPRNIVDDLLSLHASDPQFLPESNLGFLFSTPMLAAMYLGDMLGFSLHALASQRALQEEIRAEGRRPVRWW